MLCNTTSPLTHQKIDLNRPCTDGDTQRCHIFDELSAWNELLCHCRMELKEVAPKKLVISGFHGSRPTFGTAVKGRYVLVLVHWLLKEHRCVKLLRIRCSVINRNPELLCDALRLAVGLKSLEIWGWYMSKHFFDDPEVDLGNLMRTISTLAGLEELKLEGVPLDVAILKTAFENMACLRSFVLKEALHCGLRCDPMATEQVFLLMDSLRCSKSITELYIDYFCLDDRSNACFAEYLGENSTLESLTICVDFWEVQDYEGLEPVLAALARNKALHVLYLIGYPMFQLRRQLVVETMTANQTLRSLRVTDPRSKLGVSVYPDIIRNNSGLLELDLESAIIGEMGSFAEAICVNKTMQKLSLNWSGLSVYDTKEFCHALTKNQSLQMVTMNGVDEELVEPVYNLVKETGTEHRVHFTSVIRSALVLQGALENCSGLKEACYCPAPFVTASTENCICDSEDDSSSEDDSEHGSGGSDSRGEDDSEGCDEDNDSRSEDDNDEPEFDVGHFDDDVSSHDSDENSDNDYENFDARNRRAIKDVTAEVPAFHCLNLCKHLVKLVITMNEKMHEKSAELLARFLSSTRTLKSATLSFATIEASTQSLLDGLSCNKTLSKLELGRWCFRNRHAEDFAQTLRRNKTLNHVTLLHMRSDLILQEFAKYVADNKFLVCINIDGTRLFTCELRSFTRMLWMFQIMDILRRNQSLLQRAVHFIMGDHSKQCGEAFEQLFQSQALLERVQELASVTESTAKERILNSKRHLDINFLVVAGVVNDRVACSREAERQVKLDQLGVDNWLLVRSYLKLTDIRDEPRPPP
ncbi:unnamed protein product, partial [Ixodes hexagonus]